MQRRDRPVMTNRYAAISVNPRGGKIMELKPGDVVILKSGGHPMTVAEVHDQAIVCLWMGEEGDLFRETLPVAVLEMARIDESDDEEDNGEDEDEDEAEDEAEDEDEDEDEEGDLEKSKVA
jgi:uncharacterized protein YodC (DUF2158 family)